MIALANEDDSESDGEVQKLPNDPPRWLANGRSWQLKFLNALRSGSSLTEAGRKARVSPSTIKQNQLGDAVFASEMRLALKQRPSAIVDRIEKELFAIAESKELSELKLKAILKILAVYAPERYSEAMTIRHSGLPSSNLMVDLNVSIATDEELLKIATGKNEVAGGDGIIESSLGKAELT